MNTVPYGFALKVASRIFRVLMRLLPKPLYQGYAREMGLVFDDSCRTAAHRSGWRGLLVVGLRGVSDLLGGIISEGLLHLRQQWLGALFVVLPALLFGILAGWVDLQNDEVQAPVFFVLVFSFALGTARPRQAWLSATLVGMMLPTMECLARTFHWHIAYLACGSPKGAFLALIPAFIGAYAGAATPWIFKFVRNAALSRVTRGS